MPVKRDHPERSPGRAVPADDAVTVYFDQIGAVPLLSSEEEVDLAKRMEAGRAAEQALAESDDLTAEETAKLESRIRDGVCARQHFIEANTRLVISVAKHYREYGLPFQDLIQAGNIGLIRAVDKFDYRMGNRFSTYAIWWIRQSIRRTLSRHSHTIRLPTYLRSRLRRIHLLSQELEKQLGRRPSVEELAEASGEENPHRLRALLEISRQTVSLNQPIGEEGDGELLSLIADEQAQTPAQTVQARLLQEDVETIMDAMLSEPEIEVLSGRFGLRGHKRQTLRELSEVLGVSSERVRQIERQALRKLRRPRSRRRLLTYLH